MLNMRKIRHMIWMLFVAVFLTFSNLQAEDFFDELESSLEFESKDTEMVDSERIRDLYDEYHIPHPEHINLNLEELAVAEWEKGNFKFSQISPGHLGAWEHTFLVFRKEESSLSYLGAVDFKSHKYGPPSVSFAQIGGDDFLVFRRIGMSGTGVMQYSNDWMLLGDDEVKLTLRVLDEGHVMGWGNPFNRTFKSVNLVVTEEKATVGISYIYEAFYWPTWQGREDGSAALKIHTGAFWRWDGDKKEFVHDKHRSPATEKQLLGMFNHGTDGVVADNIGALRGMELNEETIKWLHLLEDRCEQEKNKAALREILGKYYENDYLEGKDIW